MVDLLSNYWMGLLLLGPLAGVFWSILFKHREPQRSGGMEHSLNDNSGQVIIGNNNHTNQVKDSYNKTTVNNYRGNGNKSEEDPMAMGIIAIAGAVLVGAALAWGMAKYGVLIVSLELALVTAIGICLISQLVYKFYTGEYENLEFPAGLVLIATALTGFFTANNLSKYLRADVTEMALGYKNIVEFFFDLSTYGKVLLVSQGFCAILILLNQAYVVARAYGLQRGHCGWQLDVFLLFPILGVLPLWLSHPNWGAIFIVERLAQ